MAGARHVGKVVLRHERPDVLPVRADGTYLVTGGLGGLGLLTAGWLVERGARHLLLTGRRGLTDEARAQVETWRQAGVEVRVEAVDVADEEVMRGVLGDLGAGRPLRGVIHAAGVLEDGLLVRQGWEPFCRVLRPKAGGAWVLDRLTRTLPLDFFVLYSSAASLLGSAGQGSYAAANGFLDGLAHARWGRGEPATVINWGAWSVRGMATRQAEAQKRRWQEAGAGWLSAEQGLAALEEVLRRGWAQALVSNVDWPRWQEQLRGPLPPLLQAVAAAPQAEAPADEAVPLADRLRELPGPERRPAVLAFVRARAARVMGLPGPDGLDVRQPLQELGLDSLMAVELTRTLAAAAGHDLPATALFNYPTIEALAGHLAELLGPPPEGGAASPPPAEKGAGGAASPPRAAEAPPPADDPLVERIERLSGEEAARLLEQELSGLETYLRET
jgi:polyketide synthase 12/myxalamid-type polyketide synthase MxaB